MNNMNDEINSNLNEEKKVNEVGQSQSVNYVQDAINAKDISSAEEKKVKKNIAVKILLVLLILCVGMVSGFYILKGLNSGVKQNSFMYKILSSSGLLISGDNEDLASDSDFDHASDSNNDSGNDVFNSMVFIQEKDGYNYYYYLTDDGDYLYYYSDSEDIYNYYASDSNGNYMDITYMDEEDEELEYVIVPDFTKLSLDDAIDQYDYMLEVIYLPNSEYEENAIYYQNIAEDAEIADGDRVMILVNANE